jgi:hypothetical protein
MQSRVARQSALEASALIVDDPFAIEASIRTR